MPDDRENMPITRPDHITLVGKKSGRELKLVKTVDDKGVVFYEAALDGRTESDK